MTLSEFETLTKSIGSIITSLSIVIAGIWAYRKFILQEEKYPNLNFSADINFIGRHDNDVIIELIAIIENKGKAQHKMMDFSFDINGLSNSDILENSTKWDGQVNFPQFIQRGSFLPSQHKFFFVDPNTTAKYSYITKVSTNVSYLMLHTWFRYHERREYMHMAEKTMKVPVI